MTPGARCATISEASPTKLPHELHRSIARISSTKRTATAQAVESKPVSFLVAL